MLFLAEITEISYNAEIDNSIFYRLVYADNEKEALVKLRLIYKDGYHIKITEAIQ